MPDDVGNAIIRGLEVDWVFTLALRCRRPIHLFDRHRPFGHHRIGFTGGAFFKERDELRRVPDHHSIVRAEFLSAPAAVYDVLNVGAGVAKLDVVAPSAIPVTVIGEKSVEHLLVARKVCEDICTRVLHLLKQCRAGTPHNPASLLLQWRDGGKRLSIVLAILFSQVQRTAGVRCTEGCRFISLANSGI